MRNSDRFPHLARSGIFKDLPDDFVRCFLDQCSVKYFDRAATVLSQDEIPSGLYLVAHGSVEINYISEDGHRLLIHRAGEGEVFGEIESISENACAATCESGPDTTLLFCAKPLIFRHLTSLVFVRNLFAVFYDRLVRDNHFKFVDQRYPVGRRLCAYLHYLSAQNGKINANQSFLAEIVGCSRQSINRELGYLREKDIISIRNGVIRVTNRHGLDALQGMTESVR